MAFYFRCTIWLEFKLKIQSAASPCFNVLRGFVWLCVAFPLNPKWSRARMELMMWSCRCLQVNVMCFYFLCRTETNARASSFAHAWSLTCTHTHTPAHPPQLDSTETPAILIYNLLFCISRFVFTSISLLFMCDLDWHFLILRLYSFLLLFFLLLLPLSVLFESQSGLGVSVYTCVLFHVRENVSEDVVCLSNYVLCILCVVFFTLSLNQMKFIINSWISFTRCVYIHRHLFVSDTVFSRSSYNLYMHDAIVELTRFGNVCVCVSFYGFRHCGRIYFPFDF